MLGYHALFMTVTVAIVARGIERAVTVLMPALAVLMVALAVCGVVAGDLDATLRFLLRREVKHMAASTAIEALGLGFFSIGVGLGLKITYAAYASADLDHHGATALVCALRWVVPAGIVGMTVAWLVR